MERPAANSSQPNPVRRRRSERQISDVCVVERKGLKTSAMASAGRRWKERRFSAPRRTK
jgi:hypothetical protein